MPGTRSKLVVTRKALSPALAARVDELAGLIVQALAPLERTLQGEALAALAVDCHPWLPVLELSLLTQAEVEHDPLLKRDEEQASWKHFQFTRAPGTGLMWPAVRPIADQFNHLYRESRDKREAVRDILTCCALALSDATVRRAIERLQLQPNFELFVVDPDDPGKFNYCSWSTGEVRQPR